MSFRPRIPKTPRPLQTYIPVPGGAIPHHRRTNQRQHPLVYLSDGRTLAQPPLPPLFGQVGFNGDRPQDGDPRLAGPLPESDSAPPNGGPIFFDNGVADVDEAVDTRHARKREKQSTRWNLTVIPSLVPIYIQLVHKTDNLRMLDTLSQTPAPCTCTAEDLAGRGRVKHLKVMLVRWQSLDKTEIRLLLEFVMQLFLNMPPNNIALTKTLESYLDSLGYKLDNRDALRRRFGNTLEWYTSMRHVATNKIDSIISLSRDLLPQNCREPEPTSTPRASPPPSPTTTTPPSSPPPLSPSSPASSWRQAPPSSPLKRRRSSPAPPPDSSPPASPSKRSRAASPSPAPSATPEPPTNGCCPEYPFAEPADSGRPSDYLRTRCLACFGGKWEDPSVVLAILLSGDACFTHRRNQGKGKQDPPHQHPESVFKRAPKTQKAAALVDDEVEDYYENADMPVPKSVLDECEASFTAADERRTKSSTQFFDDTVLMGLNCRHDHLLFLVNMKTAGEKQFYMYALLEMLFQHLPRAFVIGFLYDIACQLERSAHKWGFLPPEYLDRLQFAVSVLHAFGHNWVCQMMYHPRRRTLFGLTDGDGCEHFWHSISKLISYLRVCGYHRRLYTLNSQIHHLQKASIRRLGTWLARRWAHCQEKRRVAEEVLRECKQPLSLLRAEYKKQLTAQTRPLPKCAKNAGKLAVEEVLRLRKVQAVLKARVEGLEEAITEDLAELVDVEMAERDLAVARQKLVTSKATLRRKEAALGVDDRQVLRNLVTSGYIQAWMNARALRYRLRHKLCSRKFELDRVERTFHRKKTDLKLKTHIEDAVKRRDPGIQELVRNYNKLCAEMATLLRQGKAPRNAVPPTAIDPKSVWSLDVDDEIWQDIGLDDAYDESEPPLWLKSEAVRDGIKAMLEQDRCNEEAPRLFHECRALCYWLSEEWAAVGAAVDLATEAGNSGVHYQLQLRRHELCQLAASWDFAIRPIPFNKDGLPAWGPTEAELMAVQIEDVVSKTTVGRRDEDGDVSSDEEEEEEEDELPVEEIEAFQQGAVYAEDREHYYMSGEAGDNWGTWTDDNTWFAQ
ncbi:hypothetical protein DFH09DRAFT_1250036 [Mycena vulgaris]|nr:hypothetical protein DFH09DRAFT_1250036 [Mycena vulgaris]